MTHTNGIESFWTLLRRGYHGVHHHMRHKHLKKYIDEFATRHNRRNLGSETHINAYLIDSIGKKLSY